MDIPEDILEDILEDNLEDILVDSLEDNFLDIQNFDYRTEPVQGNQTGQDIPKIVPDNRRERID